MYCADGGTGSSAVESSVTESRPVRCPSSGSRARASGLMANIAIVLVVSKQPLKCTKNYNPPDTKVTVRVSAPSFLTTMMSSSLGSRVKEFAKQATSCGRLMTCPPYAYCP